MRCAPRWCCLGTRLLGRSNASRVKWLGCACGVSLSEGTHLGAKASSPAHTRAQPARGNSHSLTHSQCCLGLTSQKHHTHKAKTTDAAPSCSHLIPHRYNSHPHAYIMSRPVQSKAQNDLNARTLRALVKQPDNKSCADCVSETGHKGHWAAELHWQGKETLTASVFPRPPTETQRSPVGFLEHVSRPKLELRKV